MNAHTPLTPMKAAELVSAAGIEDARTIIADFAAAGLVKSYALVTKTIDARGASACVRGATIPAELWQRIVAAGVGADVWSSGTVRLAGSELVGGQPAAIVTGITFKADSIDWVIAHHAGVPASRRRAHTEASAPAIAAPAPPQTAEGELPVSPKRQHVEPAAIPPGALFASMEQTMRALNKSRGTIYNLIEQKKLVRKETGLRSVSIEVASIWAFAGANR